MTSSDYIVGDDNANLAYGRYRGAVAGAIRGKRGQAFLKEMVAALDAMDDKRLCTSSLLAQSGDVCALGAVARSRGMDIPAVDWPPIYEYGPLFGIAEALADEVIYWDHEVYGRCTQDERWLRMRAWAQKHILP